MFQSGVPLIAKPTIDESQWPIVIVQLPASLTAEELEEHFDDLRELGERTSGTVLAVVESQGVHLNAVLRMNAGDKLRELVERFGSRISGIAYVADSMATRGIITAVHWISRPDFPTATFANHEEALLWCHERLPE